VVRHRSCRQPATTPPVRGPALDTICLRAATALAAGLAVLVNALDVDRVVLGGPIWSRISSWMLAVLPGLIQPQLAAALSR
jgi:predicted NBD/HSP70 family sugar kinase